MQLGLALMHFHHSADGQAHADEDRLTDTNCDRQHLATVNQPPAHRSTTTAAHTHTRYSYGSLELSSQWRLQALDRTPAHDCNQTSCLRYTGPAGLADCVM